MFKDKSLKSNLKSKLAFFAGLIFCSNIFLSLPVRSASALAERSGKERKKLEQKINPAKNANFDFKDLSLNIK